MDWSRIKTIFIIVFLLLNVYLISELFKLNHSTRYNFVSEVTIENKLSGEEIKYGELPSDVKKENYISATPKKFTKEELQQAEKSALAGQILTVSNGTTIEAILEKPIKISDNFNPEELAVFLKNNIVNGEEYRFYEIDREKNEIIFYQQYENKLLYKNLNGELIFYFNDNNEIIAYKQTILEDFKELSEEENILQPIKAIEILYDQGKLPFGCEITKVELGYYTLVHLTSSQVLTPVWRVVVNGEEDLFVNAVEGQVIQLSKEETMILE